MRKLITVAAGFFLLAAGLILALPGVPGPGLAIMIVGLVLLGKHFHWARRTLEWARQKAGRLREKASRRSDPKA